MYYEYLNLISRRIEISDIKDFHRLPEPMKAYIDKKNDCLCPICLESLFYTNNEKKIVVRHLLCNSYWGKTPENPEGILNPHVFHESCAESYFIKNNGNVCPVCRHSFSSEMIISNVVQNMMFCSNIKEMVSHVVELYNNIESPESRKALRKLNGITYLMMLTRHEDKALLKSTISVLIISCRNEPKNCSIIIRSNFLKQLLEYVNDDDMVHHLCPLISVLCCYLPYTRNMFKKFIPRLNKMYTSGNVYDFESSVMVLIFLKNRDRNIGKDLKRMIIDWENGICIFCLYHYCNTNIINLLTVGDFEIIDKLSILLLEKNGLVNYKYHIMLLLRLFYKMFAFHFTYLSTELLCEENMEILFKIFTRILYRDIFEEFLDFMYNICKDNNQLIPNFINCLEKNMKKVNLDDDNYKKMDIFNKQIKNIKIEITLNN